MVGSGVTCVMALPWVGAAPGRNSSPARIHGSADGGHLAAHGFMGLMTDSEDGAALEIHEITFDARDPHVLAAFWAALLEREVRPGDMPQDDSVLILPTPGQPGLLFLRVPEGKTAKNRIHFDLWPTSTKRDEQIERATRLGAVMLSDLRRADGTGWAVFADPDGNEFCIGRSAAERAAKAAGGREAEEMTSDQPGARY
jgi:predicted enzyme related to lactoylglutathione lyase